jgi:hypothetical protein
MAVVMCDKHGDHGACAVCQHINGAVRAGSPVPPISSLMVGYEGHRLGPIWFCAACASRYEIPPDGLLLTGDEGLDTMFALGWVPTCPLCFRNAGGQVGWVLGEE